VACRYIFGAGAWPYDAVRSRRRRRRADQRVETLVATRGLNFPISRLEARLMCPSFGNRRVTVVFEPPSNAAQMGGG
jgi:hypothetical protein